jgi:hypothetical protein
MKHTGAARAAICAVTMTVAMLGPVAGASASKGSIESAIASYNSRILVAEGHVVTALGEYNTTKDASGVETAIGKSISVLGGLRGKVAIQPAARPRVRRAKLKIETGLQNVIGSYRRLGTAFAEQATDPAASTADATAALTAVKTGRRQLLEGVKLLLS